jgi:uncharacterized protein (TIGR02996 family)
MRTFALDRGQSMKYWHIDLQGTTIHLAQGQVGGQGRSETHSVKTEDQAPAVGRPAHSGTPRQGLLRDHAPSVLPTATGLRDALERAILEDPDDLASCAAYADWLSAQPEPADQARAELSRLQ